MGQYYTPVIKRNDGNFSKYYSHDYHNGLKLTEHSYIGNNFVDTVLKQLYNRPGQLAWVGDYAEPSDVESPEAADFIAVEQKNGGYRKPVDAGGNFHLDKVVINHSKNEYVDLLEYKEFTGEDWAINPIPLLTTIGNGKGGGDYYGTNMDMVGYWACDLIEVKNYIPAGYKNITEEVIFEE